MTKEERAEKIEALKKRIKEKLGRKSNMVRPQPEPVYDEDFFKFTEWLDNN